MSKYIIESQETKHKNIRQYNANQFLVNNRKFQLDRDDENSFSPFAKDLFDIPYIKTIYIADNFVAIKIFDQYKWEHIDKELCTKIEKYLNSGQPIINSSIGQVGKFAVNVYIETTQNPVVNKYMTNKKLVLDSIQFLNKEETQLSPLAQELFKFDYVKHVFFDNNYIAITKTNESDWGLINLEIRDFIRVYLQQNKPVLSNPSSFAKGTVILKKQFETADHISKEIVALLNSHFIPEASNDGGSIKFKDYDPETKKVQVILEGALRYGPTSHLTVKKGLEVMLKEKFPDDIKEVKAVFN